MAVYTRLSEPDIRDFLARFDLGDLESFAEISQGIENSNYFIDVAEGPQRRKLVLTLLETLSAAELPFFAGLARALVRSGLPVAAPIADRGGQQIHAVKGKPAMLLPCLAGQHLSRIASSHCAAIGEFLARMHSLPPSLEAVRTQVRDFNWIEQAIEQLAHTAPVKDIALLRDELAWLEAADRRFCAAPKGIVHGDLFHDNVLFSGAELTGVIDFYHACEDYLLFDLAVVSNDWCRDDCGRLTPSLQAALLEGYQAIRPWSELEWAGWNYFQRLAATRFWTSRMMSRYLAGYQSDSTEGDQTKNPQEYREILSALRDDDPA